MSYQFVSPPNVYREISKGSSKFIENVKTGPNQVVGRVAPFLRLINSPFLAIIVLVMPITLVRAQFSRGFQRFLHLGRWNQHQRCKKSVYKLLII